jgi:hypothetical protein
VGDIGYLYQLHEFNQVNDFPGQSNSTILIFLKSDFVVEIHVFWSTDKLINGSEVVRIAELQADKIPNE